jgi:hypothetical protein
MKINPFLIGVVVLILLSVVVALWPPKSFTDGPSTPPTIDSLQTDSIAVDSSLDTVTKDGTRYETFNNF